MCTKQFSHPYAPGKTKLFLDLYFQYFDLMKLRVQIRRNLANCFEYGNIDNPVLIGSLECDLQVIEKEEIELLSDAKFESKETQKKLQDLESERKEIFDSLDQHGINAWMHYKSDPDCDPDDGREHKIQLRYLHHKIEVVKQQIEKLRQSTKLVDPFHYLESTNQLTEEEMEIIIFLFYSNFEDAQAIRGDILLEIVFGRQWGVYHDQCLLFDESVEDGCDDDLLNEAAPKKSLTEHNLVQRVESGYDSLSSTFAISNYANLVISGIHTEQ